MKEIAGLTITHEEQSKVTPLELLKDFSDTSSDWHFLEQASSHYADEKNVPAIIVRHQDEEASVEADLGFVACAAHEPCDFHLAVVTAVGTREPLSREHRQEEIAHFARDFGAYLDHRNSNHRLDVSEQEAVPA